MNCKNCNSILNEGATFCPNCGQKVTEAVTVEPQITEAATVVNQTVPAKKSKAPLIIGLIVGGAVLFLVIIIVLILVLLPTIRNIAVEPTTPVVTEPEPVTPSTPTTPTEPTTPTVTDTTDEDYTVMGTDKLGYVKLPGEWIKASVSGTDPVALQYTEKKTYSGSSANGSWIVTLNVLDKTYTTSAREAANNEAEYYNTMDPDASNVEVELVTLGKYTAYKLSCKYKSDNVWVITWYFEAEDGLVHVIQVEGLDLTNDNFKIPNTFSLTKIK